MTYSLQHISRRKAHAGFNLIELMIAMVLGLMLVGVVISVFLSGNRNYQQNEGLARIQENGRYAIKSIAEDLSMVAFWGQIPDATQISPNAPFGDNTADPNVKFPCGNNFTMTLDDPVIVNDTPTAAVANTSYSCIVAADFHVGSDVLALKRAESVAMTQSEIESPEPLKPYVLVQNNTLGFLFHTNIYSNTYEYWRYTPYIYYIRNYSVTAGDGIPTLVRKTLANNMNTMTDEPVAEGVERFHVEFGIDANEDGSVDRYSSDPTATEYPLIINARIFVLTRSMTRDIDYTDDKTYQMGSTNIAAFNDNFRRHVYSSTVALRNVANAAAYARAN